MVGVLHNAVRRLVPQYFIKDDGARRGMAGAYTRVCLLNAELRKKRQRLAVGA